MPNKTAKSQRSEGTRKTFDLAPGKESLKNEAIPKSVARVLNAQKIRDNYRRKRKLEDGQSPDGQLNKRRKQHIASTNAGSVSLVIQSGESLRHFNRRVEDDLRPLVKSAMQTARAIERNAARQEKIDRAAASKSKNISAKKIDNTDESRHSCERDVSPVPSPSPKEFATALPKRLNDVAQEPPEFKKLPRGASPFSSKKDILPMSQKLLMEKERERAIQRYRELRASQRIPMEHK